MPILPTIADELTADLATGSFTTSFAPERSYADEAMQLKDAGSLRVDVVVVGYDDADLSDRAHVALEPGLDIGIRKKFEQADQDAATGRVTNEAIDPLVGLTEEILIFLVKKRLSSAVWRDAKFRSTIVREHLRDWKQFTAIIRVRFHTTAPLS